MSRPCAAIPTSSLAASGKGSTSPGPSRSALNCSLLDEPVSALDVSVGAQIMNLLRHLQQTFHLTYLFISHSMPLVRYLSTHIVVMRAGKVVEAGTCDQICQFPGEAYTKALLEATPELPT